MRFTAAAAATIAFAAGAQAAAIVDRQINVPITVSCVLNNNEINILKRWDEPNTPPYGVPTGVTGWPGTTSPPTGTPYGGPCPCTGNDAVKKRFIDERQINIPILVTCTLNGNYIDIL